MKHHVGDLILCPVKDKRIINREIPEDEIVEKIQFQVISKSEKFDTYKILIPDDYVGWKIGLFHIEYENVAKAFLGKKFYDIAEVAVLNAS